MGRQHLNSPEKEAFEVCHSRTRTRPPVGVLGRVSWLEGRNGKPGCPGTGEVWMIWDIRKARGRDHSRLTRERIVTGRGTDVVLVAFWRLLVAHQQL